MSRHKSNKVDTQGFADRLSQFVGENDRASFAKKIGVSAWMVTKYLTGTVPGSDILLEISRTVNRSMEWLLTGQEHGPHHPQGKVLEFGDRHYDEARKEIWSETFIDSEDDFRAILDVKDREKRNLLIEMLHLLGEKARDIRRTKNGDAA
jgi:transcriptional regulator with XRE-family HTH domain